MRGTSLDKGVYEDDVRVRELPETASFAGKGSGGMVCKGTNYIWIHMGRGAGQAILATRHRT